MNLTTTTITPTPVESSELSELSFPLTCVSSYYEVTNKHGDKFKKWFDTTLQINCPYIIFTTENLVDMLKSYRVGFPTVFIVCNIEDFYTYQFKDRMLIDKYHCPSVELNLIWNEKIYMIQKAMYMNPFNSDWFKWIDSGICTYRKQPPPTKRFPNISTLQLLPTDKFIFSSSDSPQYIANRVKPQNYYHHISGTYVLHKNMIDLFTKLYSTYMQSLVYKNNFWTDQVILTHIYKDHPEMFYKLCDGYGTIVEYLY